MTYRSVSADLWIDRVSVDVSTDSVHRVSVDRYLVRLLAVSSKQQSSISSLVPTKKVVYTTDTSPMLDRADGSPIFCQHTSDENDVLFKQIFNV